MATRRPAPPIDWPKLRFDYENSAITANALARKYNVASAGVYFKIKTQGWRRLTNGQADGGIVPNTEQSPSNYGLLSTELTNADGFQVAAVAPPPVDELPVDELPVAELAKMQQRTVNGHRIDVEKDMAHLNSIAAQIEASKRLTPVMKLNALTQIVKIRGQLQDLERRAWRVPEAVEQPKVAVQVNLNLEPSAAYLEMIGKGRGG